jgi:uncharacterized damage-inducible protein DinB
VTTLSILDELLIAWRKNHRITLDLLDAIPEEGLTASLSTRGGRSVARQFAHLHDVRRMQLEKRTKTLGAGLVKFASKVEPDRADVRAALEESALGIEAWITKVVHGEPGARPMPGGIVTTLAYLVSHESHHRGSITLTCKQSGTPVPKEALGGLWGEWGKKP